NGGYVSGTRGFCADGQTLTKYIWEYLGNTIPADYPNEATTPTPKNKEEYDFEKTRLRILKILQELTSKEAKIN
ncbi:MAG: hypothetical protein WC549_03835, partial [Actinomycetota bacterium]